MAKTIDRRALERITDNAGGLLECTQAVADLARERCALPRKGEAYEALSHQLEAAISYAERMGLTFGED